MVKKWQKQLDKYNQDFSLMEIIKDILDDNISSYDVVKLAGYRNLYRLRKGKIRIVFSKTNEEIKIINIDTRGDVYKGI